MYLQCTYVVVIAVIVAPAELTVPVTPKFSVIETLSAKVTLPLTSKGWSHVSECGATDGELARVWELLRSHLLRLQPAALLHVCGRLTAAHCIVLAQVQA